MLSYTSGWQRGKSQLSLGVVKRRHRLELNNNSRSADRESQSRFWHMQGGGGGAEDGCVGGGMNEGR